MVGWLLIAGLVVLYGFTTLVSSLLIAVRGSLVVFADISHRLYSVLLGKASNRMPLDLQLVGRLGRNAAVWLVTMTGARRNGRAGHQF